MAVEANPVRLHSRYDDTTRSAQMISAGRHRQLIGGLWDEMGQLQLDFLKDQGLRPEHKFLDIGCGCLRAGVKIIPYLAPQHFYGIDAEKKLLETGYRKELVKAGLQDRLDRDNLYCSRLFHHQRLPENSIDMGICVSVMTHLPLNFVRLCLEGVAIYFKKEARLFMSFFELPVGSKFSEPYSNEEGFVTSGFKDPYHYYAADLLQAASGGDWRARYIGGWNHPRGQKLVEFTRV